MFASILIAYAPQFRVLKFDAPNERSLRARARVPGGLDKEPFLRLPKASWDLLFVASTSRRSLLRLGTAFQSWGFDFP